MARFFISYNSADAELAEWVAWTVEDLGHEARFAGWEVQGGTDIAQWMTEAMDASDRMIGVCSPNYLKPGATYSALERAAFLWTDATGKDASVVPVVVQDCEMPRILSARAGIDLRGKDRDSARAALLAGLTAPVRPMREPAFGLPSPAAAAPRVEPSLTGPFWPAFTNFRPVLHREIVGRGELVGALDAALAGGAGAALTPAAALHAAGGMGKTSLARLYARERRERFEGVWWLEAETEATLVAGVDALARRLGLAVEGDAKARARAVWAAVEARRAPWLIVYDNAPSHAEVAPWLAWGAQAKLIITSRQRDFPDAIAVLAVDALAGDAAAEVLEREAQRFDDRAGALALAEALGGLPLALVQAGAYARETTLGFDACRERLVEIIERAPHAADYPASAAATLELSLTRIDPGTQAGADEWALLRLMPWLAPEGIDAKLVLDIEGSPLPAEHLEAIPPELRALAADAARLQAALSRLAARALVSTEGEGPARRAALHRVTALILRRRLAYEAGDLRAAAAAAVAAGYPGADRDVQNRASWPDCKRLNPHVAALAEAEAGPPATAAVDFLLNQAAGYWGEHAETGRALAYAETALALKIERLGRDHPEVGVGHSVLASRRRAAGDLPGAVASGEEALRIAEAHDDPTIGTDLSNLAVTLAAMAARKRADGAAAEAAALLKRVEGLERRAWAADRARLPRGALIRRLPRGQAAAQGDAPGDPALLVKCSARLNNLAETWRAQGRPGRALCFGAAALRLQRAALAPTDHRLAFSLNNVGGYLMVERRPAAARPLLREALDIREDAFAGNDRHPQRVGTARWLSLCHFALDEAPAALALCRAYGFDANQLRASAAAYRPGGGG